MTDFWILIAVVGIATVLFKASGPVFLGRRELPRRIQSVVELLAPVMLTALVVTQTVGGDGELSLDARVPGVAAAAIAVWLRAPLVGAMAVAAVVTALVRALA
ncbi:MAG: branched-chain amino acid transporter [Thermoleophilia bacterium]|jgi:branched-subunit amino acid transport protein|nr:branched-chain amino acid transporter [Thermoleophilia bacterium]